MRSEAGPIQLWSEDGPILVAIGDTVMSNLQDVVRTYWLSYPPVRKLALRAVRAVCTCVGI
jgi:hypothetical protein